jgi:hypothetical protein
MKNFIIWIGLLFVPFILVWIAWGISACSFDVQNVFNSNPFWALTVAWGIIASIYHGLSVAANDKE